VGDFAVELRHLRYFVAVAERLHFARAAEALDTAQPSLSLQIRQLEDEIGARLFDRTKRSVRLTDAGRVFLIDARRTLAAADDAVRHVHEAADGTRGELRIVFIGGAMMRRLPAVLRAYRRLYPNVIVHARALPYPQHAAALAAGTVDIAWGITAPNPLLEEFRLTTDPLVAALPTKHPLAQRATVRVRDLGTQPLITISQAASPLLYRETLSLCIANGYRPEHIEEVGEEITVLGFVASEFGIAVAPRAWQAVRFPGVVFRPLSPRVEIQEVLSWPIDRSTALVRSFVDTTATVMRAAEAARTR
jgi:DNA-binding transcriptional LysR family regulator